MVPASEHENQSQDKDMKTILEFDPRRFSREALQLILAKAQEWEVPPAEAVSRLMDEMAKRARKTAA